MTPGFPGFQRPYPMDPTRVTRLQVRDGANAYLWSATIYLPPAESIAIIERAFQAEAERQSELTTAARRSAGEVSEGPPEAGRRSNRKRRPGRTSKRPPGKASGA